MPTEVTVDKGWIPQPKQVEALVRTEYEVLYGGARGGGKTDAGMAWISYPHQHPRYRGLVIRRHADDLRDWIDRARNMYQGMCEIVGNPPEIRFPSGAKARTGHLKDEGAYTKYLGHEYQRILIEELTLIPDELSYLKLISCCRSTIPEISPQVFGSTNPGNLGHHWVKARFIDIAPWGKTYIDPKTGRGRVFIHAKVEDNPILVQADPSYVLFLDSLPPGLREAWREGSWDFVEGMAFHELTDRKKYLIDVSNPPDRLNDLFDFKKMTPKEGVKIFRSFDWGYAAPFCCLWFFSDYSNRLYLYRELYGSKGSKDEGVQMPTREIARKIKGIEDAHKERPVLSVADSSIYDKPHNLHEKAERLPSHAEIMGQEGVWFDERLSKEVKRPHSRISGVGQMHERLRIDADGMPGIFVFSTCVHWWRTMTALPLDMMNPEDVDTKAEDHPWDTTYYLLLARPFKSSMKDKPVKVDSLEFINKNFYNKKQEVRAW